MKEEGQKGKGGKEGWRRGEMGKRRGKGGEQSVTHSLEEVQAQEGGRGGGRDFLSAGLAAQVTIEISQLE